MNDVIDNDTGEVHEIVPTEMSGAIAAEISQQVATAKRYPRRSDKVISTEIMSRATLDEDTAAECIYSLPRAGKDITGPSVRFAEIVFASFGNMRAGARFVEIDTKDPARAAVIIEGVCIDMQMNNGQTVPVRRSITGKKGIFNADMTNIAFSAGAAIARREAILKTVPKSIWGAAWKQVVAVLQGDVKTLASRRRTAIEAFQKMGVDPAKICEALGVAGEEAITLEQMPRLIGFWTALRDGTETIESLFGRGGISHETVQNPLKDDPPAKDGPDKMMDTVAEARADNVKAAAKPDPITSGPQSTNDQRAQTAGLDRTRLSEGETAETVSASQKAAEGSDKPAATEARPVETNAQAATVGPAKAVQTKAEPPYHDDDTYMAYMRDRFDTAKGSSSATELWGSTREDRRELLSQDQIEELTKDKEAALRRLKMQGGKA